MNSYFVKIQRYQGTKAQPVGVRQVLWTKAYFSRSPTSARRWPPSILRVRGGHRELPQPSDVRKSGGCLSTTWAEPCWAAAAPLFGSQ
jgi:hypothetical protein